MDPSDIQPLLQSIFAALADLDLVHETEVAIVRNSNADEWLKQAVIGRLEERHRAPRAVSPAARGRGGAHPGARRLSNRSG